MIILDHLDLEKTARLANARRSSIRRGRIVGIGFLALIIAFVLLEPVLLAGTGTSYSSGVMYDLKVFRPNATGSGSWQAIPDAPANPFEVRISPSNAVWVSADDGLHRFNGTTWTAYPGTRDVAQFVLSGEEIWAIASTSVLHFDGTQVT